MIKDKTRILIAGYFGFHNTGDEAILACMLSDLRERMPSADFIVVSGLPDNTRSIHGVDAVHWNEISEIKREIASCDLVILGGGGLFQDYWVGDLEDMLTSDQFGLSAYVSITILAYLLDKPCMLYAVGIGPLQKEDARQLTVTAMSLCQKIIVRDEESEKLLQDILPGNDLVKRIHIATDPSFSIKVAKPNESEEYLRKKGINFEKPICSVCLRYWDFGVDSDCWEIEVARALDLWLEKTKGQILFLPMQSLQGSRYEDDLEVSYRIASHMKHQNDTTVILIENRPDLLAAVIACSQVCLAMRFHAVIFSILSSVPVVALAYDPKISNLMKRVAFGGICLGIKKWVEDELFNSLLSVMEELEDERTRKFVSEMRRLAKKCAEITNNILQSPRLIDIKPSNWMRQFAQSKVLMSIEMQEKIDELMNGISKHVQELDKKEKVIQALRDQRELLVIERDEIRRTLLRLQSTMGVKLLAWYWAKMKILFPEGSQRKLFFSRIRNWLFLLINRIIKVVGSRGKRLQAFRSERYIVSSNSYLNKPAQIEYRDGLFRFVGHVINQGIDNITVILSSTRFVESEGQRSTNLAIELLNQGHAVVYVYWRWYRQEEIIQDRSLENLFQIPIDILVDYPISLFHAFPPSLGRLLLVEFPYPGFFEIISIANANGWITIYDVVDDWEAFFSAGQANWYDKAFEEHLITAVDAVIAVNDTIAKRIIEIRKDRINIVPNGIASNIEKKQKEIQLKRGEVTIGYFGYISDAWFDWDLLRDVASEKPNWLIYIIGYGDYQPMQNLCDNIIFLGQRPRNHLAAYAANWDIGIVPFKEGAVSEGADPIKTYEYIAMGLPVVGTGIRIPRGGENFVRIAGNLTEVIQQIEISVKTVPSFKDERRQFIEMCRWSQRVNAILEIVHKGGQRIGEKQSLFNVV